MRNDFCEKVLTIAFQAHDHICITGSVCSGKTSLTAYIRDRPVIHTDDLRRPTTGEEVFHLVRGMPRYCVEGIHAIEAAVLGLHFDLMVYLHSPFRPLSPSGHQAAIETYHQYLTWKERHPRVPTWVYITGGLD